MSVIPPIGGFDMGAAPGFGQVPAHGIASAVPRTETAQSVDRPQGVESFGTMLFDKLADVSALNKRSDELAVKAATGDLQDVHEYTVASAESGVATQLTVAVRNKALESFNEIMRMQL